MKEENKATVKGRLVWQIDLRAMVGRRIQIETHEGHYIDGILRGIQWATVKVLGDDWQYPSSLLFHEEETDGVPWQQIKSIRLVRRNAKAILP